MSTSKKFCLRIEEQDHKVLRIIGAYTNRSYINLIQEATRLLANDYPELTMHYPEGYIENGVKTEGNLK